MKTTKYFFPVLLIGGLFVAGCDKSTDPPANNSILYEDAAESISAAVGDESGGATENLADVMIASGVGSFGAVIPQIDGADLVTAGIPVYDSLTGYWSVSVNRSFESALVQRSITREYRYQFQKNGIVQKNFMTGTDTATTLKFKIVSGTGHLHNARVSHYLTQLKGAWTSTNINKDTVTITLDSVYVRSGTDTITTRNMLRTHTGTMTLTGVNIKAPRFRPLSYISWRSNFHRAISGTISGNYTALITFQRGDAYKERSINRDFTITVGEGEGSLTINGGGKFIVGMLDGQRK
ncbi:MAG: hypothetical protein WCI84_01665 [Bacteroidota bacterium]